MNKKVNLLIIGTQKAGTTSLYEYIKQHSEIYFSDVKEVTYFVQDELYAKGSEYYHSFFTNFNNEKIVASAYVHMLPCKKCPERVKKYNKDMKFIVMLREPVSRAYSAYNYAIKNGWENSNNSLEMAIQLESKRIENEEYDLMYFENGMYAKHLLYWQEYFPKDNFLLIKDTDLKNNTEIVLTEIFDFLNISKSVKIDTGKEFNKAGTVRFKSLQSFLLSKNSIVKKILGYILSRNIKVWIRANILKKIYSFNQIDKMNKPLDSSIENQIKQIFKEEEELLSKKMNIRFD